MTYREPSNACPRCNVAIVQVGERHKWRCRMCNGVLVGLDELVTELDGVAITSRTAAEDLPRCPLCTIGMQPIEVLGVPLDRCEADRVMWFDPGELGRVRLARRVDEDPAERLQAVMKALLVD